MQAVLQVHSCISNLGPLGMGNRKAPGLRALDSNNCDATMACSGVLMVNSGEEAGTYP